MKRLLGVFCLMSSAAFGASIHDFSMKTIDGKELPLSTFRGKTVLVVNVASKCGFTPQYTALEAVYEKYKSKGLVIVGFPANNFGLQEPGTDEEIQTFCRSKYMVTFPMFSKISVTGSDKAPLYQYLTSTGGGEIQWNFTKFLVDKNGKVIKRFESAVTPDSPEVISAIEGALK